MIEYITTLDDLFNDITEYYLNSRNDLTISDLNDIPMSDLTLTTHQINKESKSSIKLVLDVTTNGSLEVGSIVFVAGNTPIGFYNLEEIIDISQSKHYKFDIDISVLYKDFKSLVISTQLDKYNPNRVESYKYQIDYDPLQNNDLLSYTEEHKKMKLKKHLPTSSNYYFRPIGGVMLREDYLMNWVTQLSEGIEIPEEIVGARFIYRTDITSLAAWSKKKIYYISNIFSSKEYKVADISTLASINEDDYILECGSNYVLVAQGDSVRVLSTDWSEVTTPIYDYNRVITDCRIFIDGLDGCLNVDDKSISDINKSLRTNCTKKYWRELASSLANSIDTIHAGRYLANYRSTFIFQLTELDEVTGILILGLGGIGAVINDSDIPGISNTESLKFEFLSESLIRVYNDSFDKLIQCGESWTIDDTRELLTTDLNFIRVTFEPITSGKLVFGDRIAISIKFVNNKTIIKQI